MGQRHQREDYSGHQEIRFPAHELTLKISGSFLLIIMANSRRTYVFGEVRVATLALLTFTTLSGRRSSGVVMAKFSGHAATFRSSPTVCAYTPRFLSASTRILSGKPPRAMWSAAVLLGLYRIRPPLLPEQPTTSLRS